MGNGQSSIEAMLIAAIGDGGSNICDTEAKIFVTDTAGPTVSNITFSPSPPNSTGQITLNATGTDNSVWVNSTLRCWSTDSSLTSAGYGGIGMGRFRNSGDDLGAQRLDNLNITAN